MCRIIYNRNSVRFINKFFLGPKSLFSWIVSKTSSSNSNHHITFSAPAIQRYLRNLTSEYKVLQAKGNITSEKRNRLLELQPVINVLEERSKFVENVKALEELTSTDPSDEQFQSTVKEEQETYQRRIKELDQKLLTVIIPPEADEEFKDIMLEVSAGVGGQEAMLFASELFDMYCNYITYKQWHMQISQCDQSELGGLRHGSVLVSGVDVYRHLKYEAGVHRVQRVPSTEKSGRVHTSTVTVAVLPQPEEFDINLQEKDLNIETKRASGAGGQHVNKTESAVRITHIPTGISVECQVDRSQIRNREIALRTLKARIYNQKFEKQVSETEAARKQQVGSSMRSEKIRTYNFNQDRITDHRLGSNFHNIQSLLMGGDHLDTLIRHLHEKKKQERLKEFINSLESS